MESSRLYTAIRLKAIEELHSEVIRLREENSKQQALLKHKDATINQLQEFIYGPWGDFDEEENYGK